jgi:GntR family transcriptional regulator/MocR family aminotransferase
MAKKNRELFTTLPLDPDSPSPLHRQLYDGVRDAILRGALPSGARLPATRKLATDLGVSRNTVMTAFEQLLAEGYVDGRHGSGTYVSRSLPESLLHVGRSEAAILRSEVDPPRLSKRGRVLAATPAAFPQSHHAARAFEIGLPALDAFPRETWGRLAARRLRGATGEQMGHIDSAGYRPLREAIASYVGTARGLRCSPEQVIVVAGSKRAIDLAARVLLDPGDATWIEDPCYPTARRVLQGAGARVVAVPVDEEGLNVASGHACCPNARLAYVTPSHQFPLGVTMSLPRRLALLEWAARRAAWILEDDYDSEYRYEGRPLASLQGLDRAGRVLYMGSFSKVLFPALRLGYLVVPLPLVESFVAAHALLDGQSPTFDQAVLADFMTEGHFVRHVRRMRTLYAERQATLVRAAAREFGGLLDVQAAQAGMHLVGWLPPGVDDFSASRSAQEAGITARPLSSFASSNTRRGGLLLGYAALRPSEIREGVRRLAGALRGLQQDSTPRAQTNKRRQR